MPKALFLDRDGVINTDHGWVSQPQHFEFIDGIFELCRRAQQKGYLLIVITNQGGIGRGLYTEEDFQSLTRWKLAEFSRNGIHIAKVYHCPYHPEHGVGDYKKESEFRKPNPGMIRAAAEEFKLDLAGSILIGDKESDIGAGRNAGVGTCLLLAAGRPQTQADAVLGSVSDAIAFL